MPKHLKGNARLAAKVLYTALEILRDSGGAMPRVDLRNQIDSRLEFSAWEQERYEKTGHIRWQAVMQFYSINYVKAGYIRKRKGQWHITPEGEDDMKLGAEGMLRQARVAYRAWKNRARQDDPAPDEVQDDEIVAQSDISLEQAEQLAAEGIRAYIDQKNPYEFQDLVAALLRAMGYYTPFIAPKGKDGGIDIIAYRDPFGIESPRIKVQVKHRQQSATVQEIRQLVGVLGGDGDVGLFVSTGGFTPDAVATAKNIHVHIQLIGLEDFIDLWVEFFPKMSDSDKSELPLKPIYFIAPPD